MKVTTNSTLITSGGQTVYLHCQVENLGDRQVNPFPRCCKWTSYKIQNSTNVSTVFSRKQAFYDYIYFVVTVKITNSKLVDRSTIKLGLDWVSFGQAAFVLWEVWQQENWHRIGKMNFALSKNIIKSLIGHIFKIKNL